MKKIILINICLIGVVLAWNGGGTIQSNSGDYWAFTPDDQPSNAPIPVVFSPVLNPADAGFYDVYSHKDDYGAIKLASTSEFPVTYAMPDSFWFYGEWYTPGTNLYISPDGFASFDMDNQAYPTGDLTDPSKPNAVMAPYWTNLSANGTGDTKRIWLAWRPSDFGSGGVLIVQWYNVENAAGNTFDFSLAMVLGGKGLLIDEGCGVIFSRHYIDFSYRYGDWGAEDPNATVGIENQENNPHYYVIVPHVENGGAQDDMIDDNTVIRFYYRKILNHDIMAYDIVAPEGVVLRYTKYNPIVMVANGGTEVINSYDVIVTITEIGGGTVYSYSTSGEQLYYYNNPSGKKYVDTIKCTTPWDKPGEIGTEYEVKVEVTGYSGDQCSSNNVYYDTVKVSCDADYVHKWSFHRYPAYEYNYWDSYKAQGTAYRLPDRAAIVTGGRAVISWSEGEGRDWHFEVWHHGDISKCGWTQVTEREYSIYMDGVPPDPQPWPEWTDVDFEHGDLQWQNAEGKWVTGYLALGEFGVMGWINNVPDNTGLIDVVTFYPEDREDISCLTSDDYSRYKQSSFSSPWVEFNGFNALYREATFMIEMKTHLGLRYPPEPPAYYEKAHDLAVYKITSPEYDEVTNSCWVVADESLKPKSWIGNMGRQEEETSMDFPIQVFFRAIPAIDRFDTYETEDIIEQLGWLGDPADDPDALEMAFSDWTPEGNCDYGDATLKYELQYIVKRNKVGPDKTDHCPYNDTMKITAKSIWKNDAWMKEVHVYKDAMNGKEVFPGDSVPQGTKLFFKCVVANTGSMAEPHDKDGSPARFVAKLEVIRDKDGAVVFGPVLQDVGDLDWRRGCEPWEKTIEFPDYWETPDMEVYAAKFTVELDDDKCKKNDVRDSYCWNGVSKTNKPDNFELYRIISPAKEVIVNYALPFRSDVCIKIYNITGKLVKILISGKEDAGYKTVIWDGTDSRGRKVSAGVYYVSMSAEDYNSMQKIIMIR